MLCFKGPTSTFVKSGYVVMEQILGIIKGSKLVIILCFSSCAFLQTAA